MVQTWQKSLWPTSASLRAAAFRRGCLVSEAVNELLEQAFQRGGEGDLLSR